MKRAYLVAAVLFLAFIYLITLHNQLTLGGDNARYILLSRSLASGQGLRLIDAPDQPLFVQTPPLWPILLVALAAIAPTNYVLMKLVATLFLFLALWPGYHFLRQVYSETVAGWAIILTLTSHWIYDYAHTIRPEALYIFLSMAVLCLSLRLSDLDRPVKYRWGRVLLLAVLAACAYLTRTIGITLIMAIFIAFWFAGSRKEALSSLTLFGLFIMPWFLYTFWARTQDDSIRTYMSEFLLIDAYKPALGEIGLVDLAQRFGHNVRANLIGLAEVILYMPPKVFRKLSTWSWLLIVVGLSLALPYATDLLTDLRRRWRTAAFALPLYELLFWGVVLVWPWTGVKFVVPIIMFIWARLLSYGIVVFKKARQKWASWFTPLLRKRILTLGLGIVLLSNGLGLRRSASLNLFPKYPPRWQRYFEVAAWLKNHTAPDAVIVCRKPHLLHLQTGRLVASFPYWRDAEIMRQSLDENQADYVVIDQLLFPGTKEYLLWYVEAYPDQFELVYETAAPLTRVYRYLGNAVNPQ